MAAASASQIEDLILLQRRQKRPQVQCTAIELPKSLFGLALPDEPYDARCRLFVQNRPKRRRLGIPGSRQATEEKQSRVLCFENERFQAAWRNDTEIGVGHIGSITILRQMKQRDMPDDGPPLLRQEVLPPPIPFPTVDRRSIDPARHWRNPCATGSLLDNLPALMARYPQ